MIKNILNICIVVFLLFGVISYAEQQGNTMSMLQKKPVFELKINGFGSRYFVKLNGVVVIRQYNAEQQISTKIPINHYMKSGDNLLAISAWSGDGTPINPNANIAVEMFVSEHDSSNGRYLVTSINYRNGVSPQHSAVSDSSSSGLFDSRQEFKMDNLGDVEVFSIEEVVTYKSFKCSRKINIPSSIPLWTLFSSDEDYY